jgi:5'(3')-deoxyribonucleotidase
MSISKHSKTIFLDMDGVVADFTGAVHKIFHYTPPHHSVKVPYDVEISMGVTEDAMWDTIYAYHVPFWSSLEVYPWAKELYAKLQEIAPVVFLTSPCRRGYSAMGKTEWLRIFTGDPEFRDYIITDRKHYCARDNAVLVDDSPVKIRKFIDKGGKGVLFPRQWNDGPVIEPEHLVQYTCDAVKWELGLSVDQPS